MYKTRGPCLVTTVILRRRPCAAVAALSPLTMPPRRISAENARETLVTKFARAEASAGMDAATPVDDSDPAAAKQAREEHLKLVREAGTARGPGRHAGCQSNEPLQQKLIVKE